MRLIDKAKGVTGLAAITPSSSEPDYVSMKAYERLTVIITCNNATTVTGSAITLKQAKDVSGTDEKALAFDHVWQNTDTDSGDDLTETDVTSDTFTTDTTDNKNLRYQLEVHANDLDVDNGFDCVRLGTGDAANTVVNVEYILHEPRYAPALGQSAITD